MRFFINRELDYAIRICAFLAGSERETFTIAQISLRTGISFSFTKKIIHSLIKSATLASKNGRNGGIFLAKPARDIDLYQLMNSLDFKFHLNECTYSPSSCPFSDHCKIHCFFEETEEILINRFKNKTLAEIAFNHQEL